MKKSEQMSAVLRDRDPYVEAAREMEEIMTARKRNWNGLPYDDRTYEEVTWGVIDPHLLAARQQLQSAPRLLDDNTRDELRHRAETEHDKWLERRREARLMVDLGDKTGVEVAPEIRAIANESDRWGELERAATALSEQRRSSLVRAMST